MGDGTVTLSNFDKAPQQIPMFSLKELYWARNKSRYYDSTLVNVI
jgi:hypothetical protein